MNELKKKSKELLADYNKSTPVRWHQIGDAIVVVGSATAAILALKDNPKSTAISLAITAILKIFTNFRK